jgi:hypothetical protein
VVISSPPPKGGRRARLAAEREARETSADGAEVLDSRPSRRARNRSQPVEVPRSAEFSLTDPTSTLPPAAPQAPHPSLFSPLPSEAFAPPPEALTQPHQAWEPSRAAEPTTAELFAVTSATATKDRSRAGKDHGNPPDARRAGSSGPNTTELGVIRSRRSARPQTKRRRAELAVGRAFSNRWVWGGSIAAALVLAAVPAGLMLHSSVKVADGGLSGTSSTLADNEQSGDSTRLAQPDVPDATTQTTGSPTAWAQAVVKATASKAAAAAAGDDKTDGAGDPTGSGKSKDPATKAPPTKAPVSGTTDGLDSSRSGLDWASGVYAAGHGPAGVKSFGAWRGADIDVVIDWPARDNWDAIVNPTYLYGQWKNTPYMKVFGVPPIPEGDGATMAGCAAGAYNDKWRQFGTNIRAAGLDNESVIRLGWEFNGDWYIWNARNPDQFIDCWRQVVTSAESTAPALRWDWNPNRGEGGSIVVDARKAYPGDGFVDFVGVDSYDMYPGVKTEADWDKVYSGAYGLKFWSDFARDHGKKLSVPEWAIYPGSASQGHNGGDNPFYIAKMHSFFKSEGSHLAYESYFNESAPYVAASLFGPEQNPIAAAKYKALFGS